MAIASAMMYGGQRDHEREAYERYIQQRYAENALMQQQLYYPYQTLQERAGQLNQASSGVALGAASAAVGPLSFLNTANTKLLLTE